jgi:pimeloyl-ACP methyl ester carboxylesterase
MKLGWLGLAVLTGIGLGLGFLLVLLWLPAPKPPAPPSGPPSLVAAPSPTPLPAAIAPSTVAAPPDAANPVPVPGITPAAAPTPLPPATTSPAAPAAEVRAIDCWFRHPAGNGAHCGILTVPERWDAGGSRLLQLRFAVLRRGSDISADPVIYVPGGPGEPAGINAGSIGQWWRWLDRRPWLEGRDLVLYDPRGVGLSEPAMACKEFAAAAEHVYGGALPEAEIAKIWAAAAAACHARLTAADIDLTRYNTAAMVADLKSLLAALGDGGAVLLASSYGTRVALRLAAEPGVTIKAMILDGVDPPDEQDYVGLAPDAARAFAGLFRMCAATTSCKKSYPNLPERFADLVTAAAAAPLTVEIQDIDGKPFTAWLDDAKLIEFLLTGFYDRRQIEALPGVIAALAGGDTATLAPLARLALDNYRTGQLSFGVFLSAECHDDFPFNPRDAVARESAQAPLFRNYALANLPLAACPVWPSGTAAAAERAPAISAVPTLILSGDLDPATPPRWAQDAAAHLPHAFLMQFPDTGHGVLDDRACVSRLVGRFIANPAAAPVDDCKEPPTRRLAKPRKH